MERFNPLDPLGIFARAKQEVDKVASGAGLPLLPGPPGLARMTEAEREVRHGGPTPERGTGFTRFLDPLSLFSGRSKPTG